MLVTSFCLCGNCRKPQKKTARALQGFGGVTARQRECASMAHFFYLKKSRYLLIQLYIIACRLQPIEKIVTAMTFKKTTKGSTECKPNDSRGDHASTTHKSLNPAQSPLHSKKLNSWKAKVKTYQNT